MLLVFVLPAFTGLRLANVTLFGLFDYVQVIQTEALPDHGSSIAAVGASERASQQRPSADVRVGSFATEKVETTRSCMSASRRKRTIAHCVIGRKNVLQRCLVTCRSGTASGKWTPRSKRRYRQSAIA